MITNPVTPEAGSDTNRMIANRPGLYGLSGAIGIASAMKVHSWLHPQAIVVRSSKDQL